MSVERGSAAKGAGLSLPISLRLKGQRVLILGGGVKAAQKLRMLQPALSGAELLVVCEVPGAELVSALAECPRDGTQRLERRRPSVEAIERFAPRLIWICPPEEGEAERPFQTQELDRWLAAARACGALVNV